MTINMIMSIINSMSDIITDESLVIEDSDSELNKLEKVFDLELIRILEPTYDNLIILQYRGA